MLVFIMVLLVLIFNSSIYDDLCDKDKLLALKGLLNRFPNVESLK